jgi:hypothetical protein
VTKSLTLRAAVQQALTALGAPAHADEIAKEIFRGGYLKTTGVTLPRTINARVSVDLRDKGEASIFVRTAPGIFGLRSRDLAQVGVSTRKPVASSTKASLPESTPHSIALGVAVHNAKVGHQLLLRLQSGDPRSFKAVIAHLLRALHFTDIKIAPAKAHRVIDLRATLVVADALRLPFALRLLQSPPSPLDVQIVQQVRSALRPQEIGLLITTSLFSAGARQEAARLASPAIHLLEGPALIQILLTHQVGITTTPLALFDLPPIKAPRPRPASAS